MWPHCPLLHGTGLPGGPALHSGADTAVVRGSRRARVQAEAIREPDHPHCQPPAGEDQDESESSRGKAAPEGEAGGCGHKHRRERAQVRARSLTARSAPPGHVQLRSEKAQLGKGPAHPDRRLLSPRWACHAQGCIPGCCWQCLSRGSWQGLRPAAGPWPRAPGFRHWPVPLLARVPLHSGNSLCSSVGLVQEQCHCLRARSQAPAASSAAYTPVSPSLP